MDFLSREENILLDSWLNGKKILIITGKVNSGKSFKAEKIVQHFKHTGKNVNGFISRGIFSGLNKTGYNLVNISTGAEYHLASTSPKENFNLKQGSFYFNEEVFNYINDNAKENLTADIIALDEIGHLELQNKGFYPFFKICLKDFEGKLLIVVRNSLLESVLRKFRIHNDSVIEKS